MAIDIRDTSIPTDQFFEGGEVSIQPVDIEQALTILTEIVEMSMEDEGLNCRWKNLTNNSIEVAAKRFTPGEVTVFLEAFKRLLISGRSPDKVGIIDDENMSLLIGYIFELELYAKSLGDKRRLGHVAIGVISGQRNTQNGILKVLAVHPEPTMTEDREDNGPKVTVTKLQPKDNPFGQDFKKSVQRAGPTGTERIQSNRPRSGIAPEILDEK